MKNLAVNFLPTFLLPLVYVEPITTTVVIASLVVGSIGLAYYFSKERNIRKTMLLILASITGAVTFQVSNLMIAGLIFGLLFIFNTHSYLSLSKEGGVRKTST